MGRASSMGNFQFKYDAAGNTVYSESNKFQRMSYFDAENRLRAADYRVVGLQQGPRLYGAWEEYRYDALGRRILVRTNAERYATTYGDGDGINPLLNAPYAPRQCVALVRRIVWDGDQELYEIQAPAWDQPTDNYLTPKLENDTTSATNGADSRFYGRVAYTHGLELDHPLNAIRMGYAHNLWGTPRSWQDSALVITPHWTWRGIPDDGSFADGGALHCKTPSDSSHQTCVLLNWSFGLDARLYKLQQPLGWFGSLLDQRTDATGDQNMRNRNYDPLSGRFTQEDPMGLAGGLNVYGFAKGDPVNFSDPFGLCPPEDSVPCTFVDYAAWMLKPAQRPLEIAGTLATLPLGGEMGMMEKALSWVGVGEEAAAVTARVIGHHPAYLQVGEAIGAKVFDVPTEVWDSWSVAERWSANQKFLDRGIREGAEFLLATRRADIRAGSQTAYEVGDLLSNDYKWAADNLSLIPYK
jgi:RHS repeat-associated protein